MRQMLVTLLAVATLFASSASADQFTELGRANAGSGALYLRGHLVPPPYVFEADSNLALYVRVDHDQAFKSTGAKRLPLSIPDVRYERANISPAALTMVSDDPAVLVSRSEVDSLALVTYFDVLRQTGSRPRAAAAAVDVYYQFPDLADSAEVTDDGYVRYWKGCPFPFAVSFPTTGNRETNPLIETRSYVDKLVKSLDTGEVLCFGSGGLKAVPNLTPLQFAFELEALQHGQPTLRQLPASVRQDFENPKSAATILKMVSGEK